MSINGLSILKKVLLLFLIIAGLHYAKVFLMPMAIASVLATLFLPFCRWQQNHRIPKGIAVFICLIGLLMGIAFIFGLLGWQISELTNDLQLIKQKASDTGTRIQTYIFNHLGIAFEKQMQLLRSEQPPLSRVMQLIAGSLSSILSDFILVLAYFFLLLYYRTHIKAFIIRLYKPEQKADVSEVISNTARVSQQYLLGLSKMIALLWVMYGIGFSILGVKNALFFAFLCGLLEIVPYIGNITGTTLTVLMAAVQGASLPVLIGIISTYGIVQFIQGWVLEPLILGPQVKINPLFTVISLVLGQLIWGVAGMFLAIPMAAMFKIVCDSVDSLKPLGFLIGELEPAAKTDGTI